MIYNLFRSLIKSTCYFYFKKIRIYQPENLDANKPLIICSNHGNSFMDAILIAINSKRTLHFLVRSDVFNTPFKRWFFGQLNMMPIYRIRDGREALKNNDSIFGKCRKILEANGAIVIFPEGNCIVEKRLRAFKAGFVHLAFNTPLKSLQVLPVVINYSKPDEFYTDAILHFLPPINVEEIKQQTNLHEFEFNKRLMAQTHDALKQHMVYIPEKTEDEFYESVLEIKRNELLSDADFVNDQIKLAEELTQFRTADSAKFERLKQQVKTYFYSLEKLAVTDKSIADAPVSAMALGLRFPFYFSGYLLNILPAYFLENIVNTKIKEKQFKSSVRMVLSLFIYTSYILVVSLLLNLVFGNYVFCLAIITALIWCYYSSFSMFNTFKEQKRVLKKSEDLEKLKVLRKSIVENLNL